MRLAGIILLILIVTVYALYGLLDFGFSDFFRPDPEVDATKPWRFESRLIFAGVAIPIVIAFVGWICHIVWRYR